MIVDKTHAAKNRAFPPSGVAGSERPGEWLKLYSQKSRIRGRFKSGRPDLKSEQFVAGTWGELFLF
jgi:hypothetical protein